MSAGYCTGETVRGTPCKARPLKGTERCGSHPLSSGSASFGTPEQARAAGKLGGRPRKPRVVDIVRERIEADADAWFDILDEARRAVRVVAVVGEGEDAMPIEVDDHNVRLKAFAMAMDRSYGRPRQEITGADGQPLQLEVTGAAILSDPDARKHAAGLRSRVGASRSKQPSRARASH